MLNCGRTRKLETLRQQFAHLIYKVEEFEHSFRPAFLFFSNKAANKFKIIN